MAGKGSRTLGAGTYGVLAISLLLVTVYGSIIPLRYKAMSYEEALERYEAAAVFDATLVWARGDWVVNAVQYAVLAFCAAASLSVDLKWYFRLGAAVVVIPVGILLASWVEFLQVYFPPRTVSLNDLIVERAGVIAGAVGWVVFGQLLTAQIRRFWEMNGLSGLARQALPLGLARQALPLYLIGLFVVSLMPFDVVLSVDELVAKSRSGRIVLTPFAGLATGGVKAWLGLILDVALFAPIGMMVAWIARGNPGRWLVVLVLGLVISATIETLQFFVFTRYCDITDVIMGTVSVMAGWWVASALIDRRSASTLGSLALHDAWVATRRRILQGGTLSWAASAFCLVWIAVLLAVSWQPFQFSTDPADFVRSSAELSDEGTAIFGLRRMSWFPFVDYYWNSRYGALDQILTRALSFVPIGMVLAIALGSSARWGRGVAVAVALAVAVVIEFGQYFIPERHPGTTDVLIHVAGAWLGFRLTRHVIDCLNVDHDALGTVRYRVPNSPTAEVTAPRRFARDLSLPSRFPKLLTDLSDHGTAWLESGHFGAILRWFEPLPFPVKVALLSVASVALSVGLVWLIDRLGLI